MSISLTWVNPPIFEAVVWKATVFDYRTVLINQCSNSNLNFIKPFSGHWW